MKKLIWIFSATLLFAACEQDQLKKLEKEKAELESAIEKKQDALKEVEKKIAALQDSTEEVKDNSSLVSLDTLDPIRFVHSVEIQGIVSTDNNITLSAENGGKVIKVYVKEGQTVSKGQRLIDLDASVLENNLSELRTRLQLAEDTYRKQDALWKKNIGTEIQYLQTKNNYEALKDQETTLLSQLEKSQLRSPINGTVDDIMVNMGEMTTPGVPVVRVVNLSDIEVKADVSEKYVGAFKRGDKVSVYLPALRDTLQGSITAVGQVINPNNRTFTLHVAVSQNDGRLKPNLLAMITAVDYTNEKAICIPSNLVQTEGYRKFVMIAVEGQDGMQAVRRDITTGLTANGMIHIESGLLPGDIVITKGHLNLEPGDLIKTL